MASSETPLILKPVPGGYIYRHPNPWIIGSGRYFFVTEEQKAFLVDALAIRRPVLVTGVTVLFVGAIVAVVGASEAFLRSSQSQSTEGRLAALTVILLGVSYFALLIATRLRRRRAQAILSTLRPTDERITTAEIRALALDGMTDRRRVKLVFMQGVSSLAFMSMFLIKMFGPDGGWSALTALQLFASVSTAAAGVTYAVQLFRRRRQAEG